MNERETAPLRDYDKDPIIDMLIKRATGALTLLSLNAPPDPSLKFEMMKGLRRALERATGMNFADYDLSNVPVVAGSTEADQRLYAAAPDLLLVARRLLKEDDGGHGDFTIGLIEDAAAAVAKATTGES